MTIRLVQPSMLLYPSSGGLSGLRMSITREMPNATRAQEVVSMILHVRNQVLRPDEFLHHVVLNFHGESAEMRVGVQAEEKFTIPSHHEKGSYTPGRYHKIDASNVGLFSQLKTKASG